MPLFTAESLGPVVTVLLILQPPSLAAIVRLLCVCVQRLRGRAAIGCAV